MIVFSVAYSIPGDDGSSRRRIALWIPAVTGPMCTARPTEPLDGIVKVLALENVPSLPSQLTLYVPASPLNVIVRVPESPGFQPSRSWIPTPSYGVPLAVIACASTVLTDAVLETAGVDGFVFRMSHAAPTFTSPFPCS